MALAQVTVYSFEVLLDSEMMRYMPFKATREAIESRPGGRVIEGSGEEVPAAALDSEGRYRRLDSVWTPQLLQQIK
jgi:hypothetical protein